MSIFNSVLEGMYGTNDNISVPTYEGYVDNTSGGLLDILSESTNDSAAIMQGLYIADAVTESKVVNEGADASIVMEGVVKDALSRIKKLWLALWSKVRAWFRKVKEAFKLFVTSGKKFATQYEKEIKIKSAKGFSHKGFVWTIAKGDSFVENIAKKAGDIIDEKVKGIDEIINAVDKDASEMLKVIVKTAKNGKSDTTLSELKEEVMKGIGHDSISEMSEEAFKAYRNGEDQPDEIEELKGLNRDDMIDVIKNGAKYLKDIEKAERKSDDEFKKVTKAIDSAEKALVRFDATGTDQPDKTNENVQKALGAISSINSLLNHAVSVQRAISSSMTEARRSYMKESESVLKALLRFKPTNEAYDDEDEEYDEDGEAVEESLLSKIMRV